jgi:hypothetical protein
MISRRDMSRHAPFSGEPPMPSGTCCVRVELSGIRNVDNFQRIEVTSRRLTAVGLLIAFCVAY